MVFDLDGVGMPQLRDVIHQMSNNILPRATFIVNSGTGLHLYYVLADPVPMYPQNQKYLREMKKYKLFLEFVDDLDIVNQSSSLKLVCFDNIYQIPVDIDTIDEYFSYSDIKILNKQYKRLKSKNEKDK